MLTKLRVYVIGNYDGYLCNNSFYNPVEETICLFSLFIWVYAGKKIDSFLILKVNYGRHSKQGYY